MSKRTSISFYLNRYRMHIFNGAVRGIGSPVYVKFLVNPSTLEMAMIPYDKKELTSFKVPKKLFVDTRGTSFRISSKGFCSLLGVKLQWDMHRSYRIPGVIYENQKIVIYDLSKAVILEEKDK